MIWNPLVRNLNFAAYRAELLHYFNYDIMHSQNKCFFSITIFVVITRTPTFFVYECSFANCSIPKERLISYKLFQS